MGSTRPDHPGSRPGKENAVQHPTRLRLAALSLAALTTLSACGGQDDSAADPAASGGTAPSESATPSDPEDGGSRASQTPEATDEAADEADLAVEIAGDDISPNAAELEVGVGDSISVSVTSDRAGELHVHSTPEQYVEFEAGDSTQELTFTTPGTVEVEDHDTGDVVAFVDVR